jgi:hypothetical protein
VIVVKVELRGANSGQVTTLGEAEICNVGGTLTRGKYRVDVYNWNRRKDGRGRIWKKAWIEGFPRKRLGGWDLLLRCLSAALAGRQDEEPDVPEQCASYWKQRALEAEEKLCRTNRALAILRGVFEAASPELPAPKCLRPDCENPPADGGFCLACRDAAAVVEDPA